MVKIAFNGVGQECPTHTQPLAIRPLPTGETARFGDLRETNEI